MPYVLPSESEKKRLYYLNGILTIANMKIPPTIKEKMSAITGPRSEYPMEEIFSFMQFAAWCLSCIVLFHVGKFSVFRSRKQFFLRTLQQYGWITKEVRQDRKNQKD